jgi:hypothetical protein
MKRRAVLTIIAVFITVATFHLFTFGFRQSDDGPYWIRIAELFKNENASGDPVRDKTFKLPVNFK